MRPGTNQLPVPRLQVLDRVKIDSGLNPIIYDRVAPPSWPAQAVLPQPDAVPQRGQPAPAEEKQSVVRFLFATVYDHEFTVLRGSWAGREYQAVSNMDFNYLTGLGMIEAEDCVFSLLMGLANESREQLQARRQTALLFHRFMKVREAIRLIEEDGWGLRFRPQRRSIRAQDRGIAQSRSALRIICSRKGCASSRVIWVQLA